MLMVMETIALVTVVIFLLMVIFMMVLNLTARPLEE